MMLSLSSKKQALKVDLIHLHKSPILGNLKGKGIEQGLRSIMRQWLKNNGAKLIESDVKHITRKKLILKMINYLYVTFLALLCHTTCNARVFNINNLK